MENMEIREVCRDKGICGGCVYQGVPYEEQLSNKFGEVRRIFVTVSCFPLREHRPATGIVTRWNTPLAIWKRMVR